MRVNFMLVIATVLLLTVSVLAETCQAELEVENGIQWNSE